MADPLANWERKHHAGSDGEAFLFYLAFGDIARDRPLDSKKYRSSGIPAGFKLTAYEMGRDGDFIDGFLQGYVWDEFERQDPVLAQRVRQSPGCVLLRGSQKNPDTLNYLRDCVGLLTFLLDTGACAIYDPQMFQWWSGEQWRERIFDPAGPVPRHHVLILSSQEEQSSDLLWLHTRGMRKFGRPDISIRRVGPAYQEAAIDLCERLIEHQAFGAVIPEGQSIRMASLPPGGAAHHAGDLDDPDFNNVHVEIVWPEPGLARG